MLESNTGELVKQPLKKTDSIKWLVSFVLIAPIFFIPTTIEIRLFLIVTVWGILMWALELIPPAIVGVLLPVLFVIFKVTSPQVAFSSWLDETPWTIIGGLIIGHVFLKTGLVKRIAYKLIQLTSVSFRSIAVALTVTCLIITPLIPSVTVKVAIMVPIAVGLCQILKLEKKDRTASAIMLVVFMALWSPKMSFMTASADSIMTANIIKSLGGSVSWIGWMRDMFIPSMLWTGLSVALIFLLKPECRNVDVDNLKKQYIELGTITLDEKKTICLSIILLVLLITESLHGISSSWIMIIVGALCFFPGIRLLNPSDLGKINFWIIFYVGGALAIGKVASSLGIPRLVVDYFYPYISEIGSLGLILVIYIFSIVVNFIVNPLALIGTFMTPIAELTTALGYSQLLGGYIMIMGFNQVLFPYEVVPMMLLYGYGWLDLNHCLKVMAIRHIVGIIFMIAITYPYWKLIGVIH